MEKEPTVVAWVSRHDPIPVQLSELYRLYGDDVRIVRLEDPFIDAGTIVNTVKHEIGAKVAVIVAPIGVIMRVIHLAPDVEWLWAEMSRKHQVLGVERSCDGRDCPHYNPSTDVILPLKNVKGQYRHYEFRRYKRIVRVEMVFAEVEPRHRVKEVKVT